MKKNALLLLLSLLPFFVSAQTTTSLSVGGDRDKFYPVVFKDMGWSDNLPTEIQIGRSSVHQDEPWRGALMAKIVFHNTQWGNGGRFADLEIWQRYNKFNTVIVADEPFIAGYRDATIGNGTLNFIIWLRGGNTTYNLHSATTQSPVVYDGVANPLPFQEQNGPAHSFKTKVDANINSWGKTSEGAFYSLNDGLNYMNGSLALGTFDTKGYKLAVNGSMRVHEVRVETANWPDYVFEKSYALPGLSETEKFIKENGHLSGIPSALDVKTNGIELADMNARLLKKIEELTLHLIEKEKELKRQNEKNEIQDARMDKLEKTLKQQHKNR